MTTILFWNINQKPLLREIVSLCHEHEVDILVLAECNLSDVAILEAINPSITRKYLAPFNPSSYIRFFYRYSLDYIKLVRDDGRVAIRRISPPIGNDFILVALHLPSKLRMQDKEQVFECTRAIDDIKEAETRIGHDRTIVIGDFNMNPFEAGMVAADGFHAVMDRRIALKGSRKVGEKERKYFYNPMWRFMGDDTKSFLGTYYYRRSGQISYFWNTFDQVLLRPSLLDYFKAENISIISQVGEQNLLKNNKINNNFSDHLPIMIELDIERVN